MRTKLNKGNDYMIDRESQRKGTSFTGIKGIGMQDQAVQESAGPIVDRSREWLGSSDSAIIAARRLLLRSCRELEANNTTPKGLDPQLHAIRSASVVLPESAEFDEAAKEYLVISTKDEKDYVAP